MTLLDAHDRPLSGTALARMLGEQGGTVYHSAVFRALDGMWAAGAIRRVESLSAYAPLAAPDTVDCICRRCGRLQHLAANAEIQALERLADEHGFKPNRLVLEVIGACQSCRNGTS